MEKSFDEIKKNLLLFIGLQFFFGIFIIGNFLFLIWQGVLPFPQLVIDTFRMPFFIAILGFFNLFSCTIWFFIFFKSFEEARQLSKNVSRAEPWMATMGPGAFFLPRLCILWKKDATGKRAEGTGRMLFCLPASSKLAGGLSVFSVPLSQQSPKDVSAFSDASGKVRLIRTEDNLYLVMLAYPAPLAKLLLSNSEQMFLPPK